jgi:hypothetical protein
VSRKRVLQPDELIPKLWGQIADDFATLANAERCPCCQQPMPTRQRAYYERMRSLTEQLALLTKPMEHDADCGSLMVNGMLVTGCNCSRAPRIEKVLSLGRALAPPSGREP